MKEPTQDFEFHSTARGQYKTPIECKLALLKLNKLSNCQNIQFCFGYNACSRQKRVSHDYINSHHMHSRCEQITYLFGKKNPFY